jgi:hypothetical protein
MSSTNDVFQTAANYELPSEFENVETLPITPI